MCVLPVLLLLLLVVIGAQSATHSPDEPDMPSQEEKDAHNNALFSASDKDGDGQHNREELIAQVEGWYKKSHHQLFHEMNTDKNDHVDKAEYDKFHENDASAKFSDRDKNGDGVISVEEHFHINPEEHDLDKMVAEQVDHFISGADKDKDGKVSRTEYIDHMRQAGRQEL